MSKYILISPVQKQDKAMSIIRTPVLPVKLELVCECSDGRMEYTGQSRWQGKDHYQHKCTKCGRTEDYELIYPHINFDPLPNTGSS